MGLLLLAVGSALGGDALPASPTLAVCLLCMVFAQAIGGYYHGERPRERFRQRLIENKFLLCLNCGYILQNASSSRVCPECGIQYDEIETVKFWQEWANRSGI